MRRRIRQRLAARGERRLTPKAGRRAGLAPPLLLGWLAMLCAFGLTGCGRASQLVGPRQPAAHALPQRCKPAWVEPNTALLQNPEQPDGRKANTVWYVLDDPFIAQMESILAPHDPWPVFCEFGLFDMNEDGTPELLIITHGNNGSVVDLCDLSGPEPVCLEWLWWPWNNDCHGVCTRQTENGRACRIDGVFGNAFALSYFSELIIPEKDGLHIWQCVRCEGKAPALTEEGWLPHDIYYVDHTLFRDGQVIFERREEEMSFAADAILEFRASNDKEGRPAAQQLEEDEYPESEREARLAASLYQQLLRGWEEVPIPWTIEDDSFPDRKWESPLAERVRRLYKTWQEQQAE